MKLTEIVEVLGKIKGVIAVAVADFQCPPPLAPTPQKGVQGGEEMRRSVLREKLAEQVLRQLDIIRN